MTTQTYSGTKQGIVRDMRNIRDQINKEIQDMTFEEQGVYLDKLLAEKPKDSARQGTAKSED